VLKASRSVQEHFDPGAFRLQGFLFAYAGPHRRMLEDS
jgi:hypothetical protein